MKLKLKNIGAKSKFYPADDDFPDGWNTDRDDELKRSSQEDLQPLHAVVFYN